MQASQPDLIPPGRVPLSQRTPQARSASWAQEQLWFIDGFHDGFPAHNLAYLIRLSGPLDTAALGRALEAVVARHEPLRTRLAAGEDGRPVQLIDPPGPVSLDRDDLSALGQQAAAWRLAEIAAADAVRPFRLARDWPLRARLIALPAGRHALVVVAHQTAFDDASLGVLQRDLAALYGETVLAPLPVTFASHAAGERARLTHRTLSALENYWRTTLAGDPSSRFPADRPRPLLASHEGAIESITIPRPVDAELRRLADRTGATLPQVLMAALQVLLHRYTGQHDIVTGVLDAGRDPGRPELAVLIGMLGGPLPVRGDLAGDPSFSQFLISLRDAAGGAASHAALPFARIVEALNLERDPGRFPVFQTGLGYTELSGETVAAAVTFRAEPAPVAASRYDISFAVRPDDGGLLVEATYTPALFGAATVRRLLGNFAVLLGGIAAEPGARLSALPIMTEAELHDELVAWNDTARPFPVICIHRGFEEQAARSPRAIAATCAGQRISYADLNRQANQIARYLRAAGVGPEALAGVCMRTGIRRLAALLGVWKAGGGYVPLDPDLPADRLAFMIADTGMKAVLTDGAADPVLADKPGPLVLSLDTLWPEITGLDGADLTDTGVAPSNVAYVIYTSGSTGQPKGVVVEHRQAINFLQGMIGAWHITPASAVLGFAAFTFDVSVMDMFMPLLAGAKVVLAPLRTLHSPLRLAELIRSSKVTFACLPPAVLNLLTGEDFPDLRTLLSAGEELSSDLLRAWLRDGLEIYNGYGPTEASIGSTFMRLELTTPLPPPIGRPKPNYQAYVLGEHLNPVPVGVTGELHIGGPGVARGYLNRAELTEQRFIADPFRPGGRLYRTGDLVRRRADGTIEFAGRIDNQVKIRGLRVELGEIEAALTGHPGVAQAVVTVITDASGERQLAGYFRAAAGTGVTAASLRSHLAASLPAYMIPAYLTGVEVFPLTANGKIDKAALPASEAVSATAERVMPRTLIETVLVDMYATVLGHEQIGATDSFFDAGGNSLQAMQLVTSLRSALDVDLDVASVFLTPTPRQLAALLRDEHGFEDSELGPDGIEDLEDALAAGGWGPGTRRAETVSGGGPC